MSKEFPNIKFLLYPYHRFLPHLHSRANYANQNKGDLFLCVHVNAAPAVRHSELTGYKKCYLDCKEKRKAGQSDKKSSSIPALDNPEPRQRNGNLYLGCA
jgi:N-acetylmuramoyl-L-alanine amidase